MRAVLLLSLFLTCAGLSQAQTSPPAPAAAGPAAQRPEKRTENIRVEDAGTRIDEVRVGGETTSITVTPKGGLPEYEIVPSDGIHNPPTGNRDSAGGSRVWKILGF